MRQRPSRPRRHRRRLDAAQRRRHTGAAEAGRHREDRLARHPRRDDGHRRRASSSTRPAASSSAGRTAMPASPAARSSSTPAARRRTAAARSRARRSTKVDRSACYMARYVAKNVVASGIAEKCPRPARLRDRRRRAGVGLHRHERHRQDLRQSHQRDRAGAFQVDAQGHHRDSGPAPADLPQDRRVRPFRPHRAGVHVERTDRADALRAPTPGCKQKHAGSRRVLANMRSRPRTTAASWPPLFFCR